MFADYWLDTEEGCTWRQLPAKVIRGTFLPVLWAHKVPFCAFKFLCIFETMPDRKILYAYLNSAYKVLLSYPIEFRGTKWVKFSWSVQFIYFCSRLLFLAPYSVVVSMCTACVNREALQIVHAVYLSSIVRSLRCPKQQ